MTRLLICLVFRHRWEQAWTDGTREVYRCKRCGEPGYGTR